MSERWVLDSRWLRTDIPWPRNHRKRTQSSPTSRSALELSLAIAELSLPLGVLGLSFEDCRVVAPDGRERPREDPAVLEDHDGRLEITALHGGQDPFGGNLHGPFKSHAESVPNLLPGPVQVGLEGPVASEPSMQRGPIHSGCLGGTRDRGAGEDCAQRDLLWGGELVLGVVAC